MSEFGLPDYDHEDAFKPANLYAGRVTQLSDALRVAGNSQTAERIIEDCKDKYMAIFNAYISGVRWAREEAKRK